MVCLCFLNCIIIMYLYLQNNTEEFMDGFQNNMSKYNLITDIHLYIRYSNSTLLKKYWMQNVNMLFYAVFQYTIYTYIL